MIIQIESGFRDYKEFPYNSEMTINVNGQPPDNKSDNRMTNLTENFIQYAFQWVGNSDNNNPLSKIKNDTFFTKIIPVNPNQCIIIPRNKEILELISTTDYFVGIELYISETKSTSNIILYDKRFFLITLFDDIFETYFENLTYSDYMDQDLGDFPIDGYFVNTSYHEKNNLILLGTTNVNYQPSTNFVISQGAYQGMIVENVTKNWKRKITNINGILRHVILDDIPSYDSDDFFIIYREPTILRNISSDFFYEGIEQFQVLSIDSIPKPDEIFIYKDVQIQFENQIPILLHPGNNIFEKEIELKSDTNSMKISIIRNGSGFILEKPMVSTENYILAIPDIPKNNISYFSIEYSQNNLIYIEFKNFVDLFISAIYLYFIPYFQNFPNLIVPTIPTQNLICVEAHLVSLILPNLPICGYNIRLSDIPYVFVTLCNSQGQGCEIMSTIYSNVPCSTKHNFVCPIANVKNPRLNFVNLTCRQKAIFKFSPRDTLRFRVSLPSGDILKFVKNKYSDNILCPPLDIPLNLNRKENEKLIFPYTLNNLISAVFEFHFL